MKRVTRFFRDLVTDPILFAICATIVVMLFAGCGNPMSTAAAPEAQDPSRKGSDSSTLVVLSEPMNVRFAVNDVVETLIELPAGSTVDLGEEPTVTNPNYRTSEGQIARSNAGFFHPMRVVSVPKAARSRYPDEVVDGWNSIAGGLYISTAIAESGLPVENTSAR